MAGNGREVADYGGPGYAEQAFLSGQPVQQVRTSYATAVAVQKPRLMNDVARRIKDEARHAGEDFYYGWGVGKDSIEGPSVKLALALARCWGNCAVEALPVQDTPDAWIFPAAFVDLETGFTLTRLFRQSKQWTVHGRMDGERKDDVRFQIGQSKAVRNVLLNALPASLIDAALREAKAGVRAKIEEFIKANGLPKAVDILLKALAKYGVKEKAVLGKMDVADKKALSLEHLVTLRGDLTALEGGQERAELLFPEPDAAEPTPAPEAGPPRQGKAALKKTLKAVRERLESLALPVSGQAGLLEQHGLADLADATEQQAQEMLAHLEALAAEAAPAEQEAAQPDAEAGEERAAIETGA
jgi:hypothetical protein